MPLLEKNEDQYRFLLLFAVWGGGGKSNVNYVKMKFTNFT